jgi:hypothetical protein
MASPQGLKRDAGSLFLGVEQAEKEAGETNDPLAADGLPTPNTPTFKKKFKSDVTEDFDILSKLNINDDGKVAPYDAFRSERLPCLAVYHSSFSEAEQKVPKVCDLFLKAVEKEDDYYNPEIELICERDLIPLLKVQNFYAKPGPIALLGGAGNGKSSLINNLVSIPGLVQESDAAHRGTNLVHELTTASLKQFSKYLVAVPYLADTQIKTIVQQHCNNIIKCLGMHEADEELTEDEKDMLQNAYDNSVEFFRILLCDRVDLKSDEDAFDFFESRRAGGEDALVKELKKHIDDFKNTRALEDGVEYHDARNVQQLADVFRKVARVPLNTDAHPPRAHPWPLLTKIQIRLDNPLLNAIPPLGDTPGTTDSNQDVVNATKGYIDEAGTIFIVERARRVAAQGTLDAHLKECIRRNKVNCIVLVLTAIDDVQIIKDYDRSELLLEDRKQLESAENLVEQLKHEEYSLKQRRMAIMAKDAPDVTDFEAIKTIDRESENISIKIACAEQKVKQVVVQIRFRQAAESVKGKLRTLERNPRAPDLKVYGVSNPQYQQHLYGYDAKKPPILDVEGTGLPELRRLLFTIPADGKAVTLRRICQNILPAIFKGIIGILTKSRLERKKEVEKVITNIMQKYKKVAKHTIAELDRSFETHVVEAIGILHAIQQDCSPYNNISLDQNRIHWEERVQKLLDGWEKTTYRGVTFMAFCRRSGRFKPKNKEETCWNDKIQNLMVEKLVGGFNAFDDDLPNIESLNATKIDALFRELIESLQGKALHSLSSLGENKANTNLQNARTSKARREQTSSTTTFAPSAIVCWKISKRSSASCVTTSGPSGTHAQSIRRVVMRALMSLKLCSPLMIGARRSGSPMIQS